MDTPETIGPASSDRRRAADWYFDFISPFAYLQLKALGPVRTQLALQPRPILFAALLDHHGHKGPAEIAQKRRFSYRFVQWQADRSGIELRFPPAHPFNPLAALRLAIAGGNNWALIEAIFERIWTQGLPAERAAHLADIAARFGIVDVDAALADATVKSTLRSNTDGAIAAGIFGVPTVAINGELFWGQDATPMLLDYLNDASIFASESMQRIEALPAAVVRKGT
ncbi:MAG: 2-hydroxychromene-2-carboxylate isomerase [Pseudomonadota bacterium]|nr:2-hydroxychromene-2-carboxylate isomerase [Pseudomonadota bacterium]